MMISVIIPAYNAQFTIAQTIESVLSQSLKDLEIIIVNDGSKDKTLEVLETYKDKIKLISTTNKGVSHARNLGFSQATGKYIQYLDADDLLAPNKLETQLNALLKEDADVAYGDFQRFIVQDEQMIYKAKVERQLGENPEVEIFTDFWCPPAAILYSKRITEQMKWHENLPIIQDARYLLDAAILKGKFVYTKGIMAYYREGQTNSLSQKNELNFVIDCFENAREIANIWKDELQLVPEKKQAMIHVLRHCINRFSTLKPEKNKEAISFLFSIEPNYIPHEKGFLRNLSKFFGYRIAEKIAGLKRRFIS